MQSYHWYTHLQPAADKYHASILQTDIKVAMNMSRTWRQEIGGQRHQYDPIARKRNNKDKETGSVECCSI
jgi:hypothetical protein